jgi:hypothetical protein
MSIINRLSLEEILNSVEMVKKDEIGELYEFCNKINFIDVNKEEYPPHCKYPEFYINYYLMCFSSNLIDHLGVIVYYRDGDTVIRIYQSYDYPIETISQSDIDEIYDDITELFSEIRHLLRLNKRNINVGCAFSTYVAAMTPDIIDMVENFGDDYRKKVDKWLNG